MSDWPNTNMNIFGWTFFGKYKYECIWIKMFWQIQIEIDKDTFFLDEYKHKYILMIQNRLIQIQI